MDRIALAKRLEGLSKVFVANSPYHRDLRAMAHVLSEIDDEKFRKVLSADFTPDTADKEAQYGMGLPMPGGTRERDPRVERAGRPGVIDLETIIKATGRLRPEEKAQLRKVVTAPDFTKEPVPTPAAGPVPMAMDASEANAEIGKYWNREASEAIRDNLLRDVLGVDKTTCCDTHRHLDKDQIPQGKHAGLPERGATLKPEQTPDIVPVLESHIVEKSHGAVRKEAGSIKGPGKPDGTGPMRDSPECQMKKKEKEDKDKEAGAEAIHEEKAEEHEEKAEGLKGEAKEHAEEAKKTMEKAEEAEGKAEKHEEKAEKVEEKKEAPAEEETPEDKKKEKKEDKKEEKKEAAEPMVVEGIELTASMEDVELSAEESEKLSKLFV